MNNKFLSANFKLFWQSTESLAAASELQLVTSKCAGNGMRWNFAVNRD